MFEIVIEAEDEEENKHGRVVTALGYWMPQGQFFVNTRGGFSLAQDV